MSRPVCPECGAQVEVTASVWLVATDEGFMPGFEMDFTSEDSTFYCRNDHQLDDWAAEQGLYAALRKWIEPKLTG